VTGEESTREAYWRELERQYDESPVHRLLGMGLRVPAAGEALVSLRARPEVGNRNGSVAGGVLGTMVDSAVCQAVRTVVAADLRTWTLEMKINYLRRAEVGTELTARGRVEYVGRSTAVGIGRVTGPDGELLAVGVVTVSLRSGARP